MCTHNIKKINDIKICILCGLTFPTKGRPFFDKPLLKYIRKEEKGENRKRRIS